MEGEEQACHGGTLDAQATGVIERGPRRAARCGQAGVSEARVEGAVVSGCQ